MVTRSVDLSLRFSTFGVLCTLCTGAAPARAGNEDEMFVGNGAALAGGAVVATVRDGGAVWYNPAGVAGAQRDRLDTTTSVYSFRLYEAADFMRSTEGDRTPLSTVDFVAVPVQIAYVRPLSDSITLGLGYFQPRSSRLILNERLETASGDRTTQWTLDGIATYAEYAFGAALGLVPTRGLRIGIGPMVRWDSFTQSADVFGTSQRSGTTDGIIESGALGTQDVMGFEPIAGVQWDATPSFTLALNLRGPRLSALNRGDRGTRTAVTAPNEAPPVVFGESSVEKAARTSVSLVRWGRYYAGMAVRLGPAVLSVDGDVQPAFEDDDAAVGRRFAWNARVGVTVELTESLTAGAGAFTDRAAADDSDASLVTSGGDFVGGSLGLQLDNEHLLDESESSDSLVFSSMFALRYAQATATTTGLVVDPAATSVVGSFRDDDVALSVRELAFYVGGGLSF